MRVLPQAKPEPVMLTWTGAGDDLLGRLAPGAACAIVVVSEDALREAYRATLHPFRTMKYEDAKVRLRRWLVAERMRSAELEFLQSARARIKIATVLMTTPDERARY